MMNTPRIKKIKYLLLSLEGLIRLLERRKVMPLVLAPSISLSLSLLTSLHLMMLLLVYAPH